MLFDCRRRSHLRVASAMSADLSKMEDNTRPHIKRDLHDGGGHDHFYKPRPQIGRLLDIFDTRRPALLIPCAIAPDVWLCIITRLRLMCPILPP